LSEVALEQRQSILGQLGFINGSGWNVDTVSAVLDSSRPISLARKQVVGANPPAIIWQEKAKLGLGHLSPTQISRFPFSIIFKLSPLKWRVNVK
jgi:hypothetical protein